MPTVNGDVNEILIKDDLIYIGGTFNNVGGQPRNLLASIDRNTGLVTAWHPVMVGATVASILVNNNTVYVGGTFSSAGGQPRNRIAALDATTGLATAWNPNAGGSVGSMILDGNTLYVAGSFFSIGGQTRRGVAALDVTTGLSTAWDANSDGGINSIKLAGNILYTAGNFTAIGGQPRNRIAALDLSTGLATPWDPGADNNVFTLVVNDNTIYAGGIFQNIGGQPRSRVAAIDAATGLATSWNPNPNSTIHAISIKGTRLYLGGGATAFGGEGRFMLAAYDILATLPVQLISFNANPQNNAGASNSILCRWSTATEENSSHFVIERSGNNKDFVFAGQLPAIGNSATRQDYSFIDPTPINGISYYRLKPVDRDGKFTYSRTVAVTTNQSKSLFTIYPNPSKEEATLAVLMDKKQNAVYNIYDQAGKRLLSNTVALSEGLNTISLPIKLLSAGIYIIQLNGGGFFKQSQFVKQ